LNAVSAQAGEQVQVGLMNDKVSW